MKNIAYIGSTEAIVKTMFKGMAQADAHVIAWRHFKQMQAMDAGVAYAMAAVKGGAFRRG